MLWWTIRKLKARNSDVRVAAITELASNPDPRAREAVVACLQDSATQRALSNSLASSNATLRRRTAEALIRYRQDPSIFYEMLRLEFSKKCEEHGWATTFSSNLADSSSIQFFLSLMDEKDYYLRMGGAAAIAKVGAPAVPHLLNRKGSKDDYTTASALEQVRDPKAVEALIKAVETRHSKYWAIAEALGEIGDSRAIDCLVELLNSQKHKQAAIALKKLRWTPHTDSERSYFAAYTEDWNGLVSLGPASTEALLKILGPYNDAPSHAYEVAGKVGDERIVDQLLANLATISEHRDTEKLDGIYSEEYRTRSVPKDPEKIKLVFNALVRALERNVQKVPVASLEKISHLGDSLIVVMQEYASCRGTPARVLSESVAVDFSMARQLAKQELVRRA